LLYFQITKGCGIGVRFIEAVAQIQREQGFEVDVHETYVTKTNIISGAEFQERYDTPYFCSPSSETFWSN